jgi:uncharacterized protein (DUF302 family)
MSHRKYLKPPWMQRHVGNRMSPLFRPSMISKLSVRGRRTGRWHTTPVAILEHNGERYLISYRGASDWARNLEVSHSARLIRRGNVEEISVVDVPVDDRGALLSAYADRYGKMPTVGPVLRALSDPADHPVFRITSSRSTDASVQDDDEDPLRRSARTPREGERAMSETTTTYAAVRITFDSDLDFNETRARFDERVPVFENSTSIELVLGGAPWAEVQAAVDGRVGPTGLVALERLDQGALLSLEGEPLEATLYLVGNPIIAREVTRLDPAAALYAPFRVAVYGDASGAHIAYDKPSSVFASLRSSGIDVIAAELDDKIRTVVESACR